MTLFFSEEPVRNFADATACDTEAHAHFCRALLDRGVYPPPAQFEAWFVSLAHNEASVDRTLEAAGEALDEVPGVSARAPGLARQLREEDTPIAGHVVEGRRSDPAPPMSTPW